MNQPDQEKFEGRCTCGLIRFRMEEKPLIVHCCHCRWCQRETGASFALNAMIETDRLTVLEGEPEMVTIPSESGRGQKVFRCRECKVALWSHYPSAGDLASFVRVGTLVDPDRLPPDVHIFTESKQPWVVLPPDTPAFEIYYRRSEVWSKDSLVRRERLLGSRD